MPIHGIEFRVESTQEWVGPDQRDPADEDGLRLLGAGPSGTLEVLYADIPGNSWNANRLAKFQERANELLVKRIPIASLPDGDPDKTTDPATNRMWWENGDLCSRSVIISDINYTAESGLYFRISVVT